MCTRAESPSPPETGCDLPTVMDWGVDDGPDESFNES